MSKFQEAKILVPKSLVIVKTRSSTRNCENCKHLDYFGDYGIDSCEKWGTQIESTGKVVCKAFCKRGRK